MNINLTPQLEEFVQGKVATGQYNNASEVLREALRLLIQQEEERNARLAWLRTAIQQGLDSPVEPWEGAEALIRQARARRAAQ